MAGSSHSTADSRGKGRALGSRRTEAAPVSSAGMQSPKVQKLDSQAQQCPPPPEASRSIEEKIPTFTPRGRANHSLLALIILLSAFLRMAYGMDAAIHSILQKHMKKYQAAEDQSRKDRRVDPRIDFKKAHQTSLNICATSICSFVKMMCLEHGAQKSTWAIGSKVHMDIFARSFGTRSRPRSMPKQRPMPEHLPRPLPEQRSRKSGPGPAARACELRIFLKI